MKYKIGDKVRIKSLDWYNENKNNKGIIVCGFESFTHPMSYFCNKVVSIITIQDNCYRILEDDGDWYWTDEMIEGLVEEESATYSKVIDNGMSNPIIAKTSSATIDTDKCFYSYSDSDGNLEMEWNLPQGYQFVDENGNVINATKIVLEKKKKEYPKTYEECCEILGGVTAACWSGYKCGVLGSLNKLLICRDAYWKIAGEEMGLSKPWEPDWSNLECDKFCIWVDVGDITLRDVFRCQHILAFPSKEMRNAFYENFKSEIESCKELL